MAEITDVIVVGGGLAGLVAATEIADTGKRVIVVDQEGEQGLGGQPFGRSADCFLVGLPEQRRLGIKDCYDLALQDWMGTAGFDRDDDHWPKRWAEAYVGFAAGEKRDLLRAMGHRIFPWSAGPSAAAMTRWATAIRCRAFTSPGAPAPACRAVRTPRTRSAKKWPVNV